VFGMRVRTAVGLRWRVAAVVSAVAVVAAGCGSSKKSTSTSATTAAGGATSATTVKVAAATLNGSGSTFQQAYDQEAIKAFMAKNPQVTINYGGGGSGKGLTDLQGKLVDLAGTDTPIAASDLAKYSGGVLYFPTVAAPITVSYHLSGVSKLTLSPATIAGIFADKITTWSDPAIAADNPGAKLPSSAITSVHRSDGSGTTANFSLYLTKAAASDWTLGTGKTINWPGGQAASGNPGVAQIIKSTEGAVGYVDYSTAVAVGLALASIKNRAGTPVAPTLAATSAALAGATINADLTYDPTDAPGPSAYPIASPTWIVIYKTQTDKAKGTALAAFLRSILTDGQGSIAKDNDYAPLSPALDQKAIAQLDQIVIPAQ
jgi:phosphate transport system substrate-binding protein